MSFVFHRFPRRKSVLSSKLTLSVQFLLLSLILGCLVLRRSSENRERSKTIGRILPFSCLRYLPGTRFFREGRPRHGFGSRDINFTLTVGDGVRVLPVK